MQGAKYSKYSQPGGKKPKFYKNFTPKEGQDFQVPTTGLT